MAMVGWKVWSSVLAVAAACACGVAAAPRDAHAADACGSKENPCPLQKWMRANLSRANASGDMTALAAALDRSAALAPDASWNAGDPKTSWKGIAEAGAAAARANDEAGAKLSCKACHDLFKDKYKAQFRTRPIP